MIELKDDKIVDVPRIKSMDFLFQIFDISAYSSMFSVLFSNRVKEFDDFETVCFLQTTKFHYVIKLMLN